MLSGLTTLSGGIPGYFALDSIRDLIHRVLSFSVGSFIYIVLANLVPQMHEKTRIRDSIIQIALITAGILIIYLFKQII